MASAKKDRANLAEQGWKQRGGEISKFEMGTKLQGIYLGMTPAKNEESSPIIRIQMEDGTIERYWAPTILSSNLEDVDSGTEVLIICLGQTVVIKGRKEKAWGFEVYTK